MKRNKVEWKNHLIELIVVFFGITLAFMLNNWREQAKNNQIESQYLSSFHDEIVNSNAKLDTIIKTNKVKIRYLTNTIALLKSDKLQADSTMAVIAQMAQISLFIPKTNTYESIKNSGNFNIIESYEIRSKIIEYYESFEGKRLVEEYYKMYINNYIIPYFFENVDILNSKIINKKGIESYRLNNLIVGYYQLLVQVVDTYDNIYKLNKLLIFALENEHQSLIK
jgi:hypothetical protein